MWGDTLYEKTQDQGWIVGCWGCWVTQKGWTSKSSSKSDRKSFLQTIDNLPEHWFSIGILHLGTEVPLVAEGNWCHVRMGSHVERLTKAARDGA